jgi:hypothetical protein
VADVARRQRLVEIDATLMDLLGLAATTDAFLRVL